MKEGAPKPVVAEEQPNEPVPDENTLTLEVLKARTSQLETPATFTQVESEPGNLSPQEVVDLVETLQAVLKKP